MIGDLVAPVAALMAMSWGCAAFIADAQKRNISVLRLRRGVPGGSRYVSQRTVVKRGISGPAKTSGFLIIAVAACLVWEGLALTVFGPGATISEIYWKARQHFPLDLLVGILIGHLTWQSRAAFKDEAK
jgi:hypothetical protein